MGREVRKVPADWVHPIDEYTGRHKPLYSGGWYLDFSVEFMQKANSEGLQEAVDWFGQAPNKEDYMPDWAEEEKTHFMMYENTSEGTPISPAFETPEELAKWLADTGASAFGGSAASYDQWLAVARGGYAPSAVYSASTGLISGVEAMLSTHKVDSDEN